MRYHKKHSNRSTEFINLDSLMDILTCVVGVMLFVVIFSVIEVRGTGINMVAPMAKDPAPGSNRIIFLCQDGRIIPFDVSKSTNEIMATKKKLTFHGVPQFVKNANKKDIEDDYFTYRLDYKQWREGSPFSLRTRRVIILEIDKKAGKNGETIEEIGSEASGYVQYLKGLDNVSSWVAFMVDEESLDLFRKAREIAINMGFAIGWDPGTIRFPYKEIVAGGGPRKKGAYTPRMPLTTTQN